MASADGLTPRARAKRDQIRDGARRVFLRRGFADATTDAIAADAGVSKQTLYVYYSSKEELLTDILTDLIHRGQTMQPPLSAPPEIATVDDLERALQAVAHRLIGQFMQPEYLGLLRMIFSETPRMPQLGSLFRSTVPERVLDSVAVLLEAGQARGVVADVDRDIAPRMLVGALLTYAIIGGLLVGDGPPRPPASERVDTLVALFVRAVCTPA